MYNIIHSFIIAQLLPYGLEMIWKSYTYMYVGLFHNNGLSLSFVRMTFKTQMTFNVMIMV